MPMFRKTAAFFIPLPALAALAALLAAPALLAQQPRAPRSLNLPADQVKYKDLGGPQLGTVWGKASTGPHGSLLRLTKGFVSPAHWHTGDYYGVIVEGSVVNAEVGQAAVAPGPTSYAEVVLGPGSYYFQKGKINHITKCLGNTDCLIYISQSSGFDFITPKK